MAFCFHIYGGEEHVTDSILAPGEKNLSSGLEFAEKIEQLDFCDGSQYE